MEKNGKSCRIKIGSTLQTAPWSPTIISIQFLKWVKPWFWTSKDKWSIICERDFGKNKGGLFERQESLKKQSIRTGLECSTVKKSGLVRNLALGDWSSRVRRVLELDWATLLSLRSSAANTEVDKSRIWGYKENLDFKGGLSEDYLGWRGAYQSHPLEFHWLAAPLVCCCWLLSCVYSDIWKCIYLWC